MNEAFDQRQYNAAYYQAHKEEIKAKSAAWRLANPDGNRKWLQERRAFVDAIKLESGCVDCGYNENAVALDFDHVRGEKISNIVRLRKREKILAEVAKCEVRCANCHRIRTHGGQSGVEAVQGSVTGHGPVVHPQDHAGPAA